MNSQPTQADLYTALEESLKLQAHYAKLLNMHDGGQRRIFATLDEWIARLRETGTLMPAQLGVSVRVGGEEKYETEISQLLQSTGAQGVVAIVIGGNQGSGFGVHAPIHIQARTPDLLRTLADSVEKALPAMNREAEGRR